MARYYGKMRSSFDSEGTSAQGLSPPQSPPRHPVYFVQSPSRDSHDGNEKPSFHSTPVMSPMASPLHHQTTYSKHSGSLQSEASSVPPAPKPGSRRVLPHVPAQHRPHKKGYNKWVPGTILEEEEQQMQLGESGKRKPLSRCCLFWISVLCCILLLSFGALIFWLVCRPHSPKLVVKKITFQEFNVVAGSHDGVPTRVLSANCTLLLSFRNPSQYFGLHVHASDINLLFGGLPIATGQVTKFYQRKSSVRSFAVNVEAIKVPLYGAGPALEAYTDGGGNVPLQVGATVQTRAHVFPLVKPRFRTWFLCDFKVHTSQVKFLEVVGNKCAYDGPAK